jgi:hypothetical protein
MMLIGAVIPLLELFDRWDAPGLSNDTEFAVFAFIFAICLVVLLCKLLACDLLKFGFILWRILLREDRARPIEATPTSLFAVPPLFVLPLRI